MLKTAIKIRIILWSILGLVVLWLIWQAVVPGGRISYTRDFSNSSFFIGKLAPAERVADGEDITAKYLIGDPVYFNLRTPRRFDKAKLTLEFKNKSELPVIEAGVLVDKILWRHALKPVDNKILDQLNLVWSKLEDNGVMLLQREKKYGDIGAFFAQPPPVSEVAVYNYDFKKEYLLPGYEPPEEPLVWQYPLRGSYEFYTYIKDEDLDFSFILYDLNRNKDADPVDINFYYQDELITSRHQDDDGITADNGEQSSEFALDLRIGALPEGVYKIELKTNNDIVTKKITTKQSKLAFINRLEFMDSGLADLEIYTDSPRLQAVSTHPGSEQIIKAGAAELDLKSTYTQYEADIVRASAASTSARVVLEKDGVTISGNGVFAPSAGALLNPRLRRVDRDLNINRDKINYVLARYSPPLERDGWQTSVINFNLSSAYREQGAYGFIISIPGLRADDGIMDFIEINSIKIELTGKSLGTKIKELFKK